MSWYLTVLKKYGVFSGRARRKEYWMFSLFNAIILYVLAVIEGFAGGPGFLYLLFVGAVLIPSIAVSVRRLHDINRSGWWLLTCFIPIIGLVALVPFMLQDGQFGENQYGPDPKPDRA